MSVVIHKDAKIGANVVIGSMVVIGGDGRATGVPTIEDDVTIGAGAKVLGPIKVGTGAKIGANAVVLKDVPPHATAVGVPARIIVREGQE